MRITQVSSQDPILKRLSNLITTGRRIVESTQAQFDTSRTSFDNNRASFDGGRNPYDNRRTSFGDNRMGFLNR
jgi:hypothetical protein